MINSASKESTIDKIKPIEIVVHFQKSEELITLPEIGFNKIQEESNETKIKHVFIESENNVAALQIKELVISKRLRWCGFKKIQEKSTET